jgi:hypothetical protein
VTPPTTTPAPSTGSTSTTVPPSTTTVAGGTESVESLLAKATQLYDEAQVAYKAGRLDEWKSKLEEAYRTAALSCSWKRSWERASWSEA